MPKKSEWQLLDDARLAAQRQQIAGLEWNGPHISSRSPGWWPNATPCREQNAGLHVLLANARNRLDYYRRLYHGDDGGRADPELFVHSPGYPEDDAPDIVLRVPILGKVDSATGAITWGHGIEVLGPATDDGAE